MTAGMTPPERPGEPERIFVAGSERLQARDEQSAAPVVPLSPKRPWARFRLRCRAPVATELKRVALDQVLGAAALVERGSSGALSESTVHESRRALTRVRGLLRVARGAMPEDVYHAENARLRDVARALSGSRDETVILAVFDKLATKLAKTASLKQHAELDQLRAELNDALGAAEAPHGAPPTPDQLTAELRAIAAGIPAWPIKEDGFETLRPGLHRTYRRARKAMKRAERRDDAESFHEWRKSVKHVRAQLRLLRDVRKGKLRRMIAGAEDLSELLGDEHDLDIVDAALATLSTRHPEALALVRGHVHRRRRKLRSRAITLGRAVLGRRPKAMSRRMSKWWSSRSRA